MGALEEIEAAIEKLTNLRTEFGSKDWQVDPRDAMIWAKDTHVSYFLFVPHKDHTIPATGKPSDDAFADAELIITLHRTIDAQLTTMRDAVAVSRIYVLPDEEVDWLTDNQPALSLARAINGGTQ